MAKKLIQKKSARTGELALKEKLRIVLVPASSLVELQKAIIRIGRIALLAKIMYAVGKSTGEDFYKYCIKGVVGQKEIARKIFEVLNSIGYGKFDFKFIFEKSIIVKLYNSPFVKGMESKRPICYWVGGLLTGLFDNLTRKEWLFEENKCQVLGDSYCEFVGEVLEEKIGIESLARFKDVINYGELIDIKDLEKGEVQMGIEDLNKMIKK